MPAVSGVATARFAADEMQLFLETQGDINRYLQGLEAQDIKAPPPMKNAGFRHAQIMARIGETAVARRSSADRIFWY